MSKITFFANNYTEMENQTPAFINLLIVQRCKPVQLQFTERTLFLN